MKGKLVLLAFIALASSGIHLWQRMEVDSLLGEIEDRREKLSQVRQEGSRIRYELAHLTSLPEIEKKIELWKLNLEFPGVGEVIYCPDPVAASELSSNRGLRGLVSNIVEKGKSIIFSRETLEAEMIPRDSLW
ncbi:MAG: hypothetical protein E3J45_05130 [Candidatus Zixiibacteriota bacterium]|nr:MAG: hypothetical protein E3J45_05130 [candidate division Zixibacteria bacterium]